MHFLITGHTGFKGSWLSLMLKLQGHKVSGISLHPEKNSLFQKSKLDNIFSKSIIQDIRDISIKHLPQTQVDVVIHLAAQPLVKTSYIFPVETYQTNVIGTLNILELTKVLRPRASLIITTDKVYKNTDNKVGYVENDSLGGKDPYSSSKAAADIATQSWRNCYGDHPIALARSGNVIGGGDFSENRLIPDLIKSFIVGEPVKLRFPNSVRPWQHVLDCLNAYQVLVSKQLSDGVCSEWNFSPPFTQVYKVSDVVELAAKIWESPFGWQMDEMHHEIETDYLILNSEKARTELKWCEKLSFYDSLFWTIDFYKRGHIGGNYRSLMETQIMNYLQLK